MISRKRRICELAERLTLSSKGIEHGIVETVSITKAKSQWSRLLHRAAAGEEITIAKRGVPVALLVPLLPAKSIRKIGILGAAFKIPDDFDAPLPDYLLDLFEGREPKRGK
jgi:prevent-host-death family protein